MGSVHVYGQTVLCDHATQFMQEHETIMKAIYADCLEHTNLAFFVSQTNCILLCAHAPNLRVCIKIRVGMCDARRSGQY